MLLAYCSCSLSLSLSVEIVYKNWTKPNQTKSMAFNMRDKWPFIWIRVKGREKLYFFKFEIFCKTDFLDYNQT